MKLTINKDESIVEYPSSYPFVVRTYETKGYFFVSKLSDSDKVVMTLLGADSGSEHIGECATMLEDDVKKNFLNRFYLLVDTEIVLNG